MGGYPPVSARPCLALARRDRGRQIENLAIEAFRVAELLLRYRLLETWTGYENEAMLEKINDAG
jgi:hypothetical protein